MPDARQGTGLFAPLSFGGTIGASGVASQLICSPIDNLRDDEGVIMAVPAVSREAANALIELFDTAETFSDYGIAVRSLDPTIQNLVEIRNAYHAELERITKRWVAAGSIYSLEVAADLHDAREKVRIQMRRRSYMKWQYAVKDAFSEARRIAQGKLSPRAKLIAGDIKGVIDGARKSNRVVNMGVEISGKAFKGLSAIANIAQMVSASRLIAAFFTATTEAEEIAALESFSNELGRGLGNIAGGAAGTFLCGVSSSVTGGMAFAACGVLIVGGAEGGEDIGQEFASEAFEVFGSDLMKLMRRIKTGSDVPLKK